MTTPGLQQSESEVIAQYGGYVRSLAWGVRRQFQTPLDVEELVAYGHVGLLEARERFDPGLGRNFLTFAHYRIKGAIYDGLRKMGVLRPSEAASSSAQSRVTQYLGALADQSDGEPGGFDGDVRDVSEAVEGLAVLLACIAEPGEGSVPADQRIEMRELRLRVRRALERLPEKERRLLTAYYFEEKTLEEAGAQSGLSKSWASRLHARALDRLKALVAEDEPPPTDEHPRRTRHGGPHRGGGNPSPSGREQPRADDPDAARAREARALEI